MSDVIAEVPAAGWYQDPNDDNAMRWWDGSGWTDHTQPIAPEPAPVPVAAATRTATTEGSAGGAWESNYTDDELALYTGRPTELPSGSTTGRTVLEFTGTVPDWRRDRHSAQTAGSWLLAHTLVLWVLVWLFWTMVGVSLGLPSVSPFVAVPIVFAVTVLFAAVDRSALRSRGIERPSLWFILLGPPGYLIARAVVVRRSGASGTGPLVLSILATLLNAALLLLAILAPAVLLAATGSSSSLTTRTEQAIQADLAAKGVDATVDCGSGTVAAAPNSSFRCTATGTDGSVSEVAVTMDERSRMAYTITPADAGPAATPGATAPAATP